MESNTAKIISFIVFIAGLGLTSMERSHADNQSSELPSETQMIQRRLLTDMKELKSRIKELTRTIRKLKTRIKRLRQTNRRQENYIQTLKSQRRELSKLIKEIRKLGREETTQTDKKRSNQKQSKPYTTISKKENKTPVVHADREKKYFKWRPTAKRNYSILKKPLDETIYYVTNDETILTLLAHKFYHDASYYQEIYEVNKDVLPSPDVVPPGVKLKLPPIDKLK